MTAVPRDSISSHHKNNKNKQRVNMIDIMYDWLTIAKFTLVSEDA
jgi:hypothetical protein